MVADIYRWFVYEGMSKSGICKRLISLGIPSPSAYKKEKGFKYQNPHAGKNKGLWSHQTVDQILRNPKYLGHMVQGQHTVKSYKVHTIVAVPEADWYYVLNTHEAIIDQLTFDKAQELNKRNTRTAPTQNKVHLFSGFLRCADCGIGLTRRCSKGYVYYACRTYVYKSKEKCTKHTIKGEVLEDAVLQTIKKQIGLVDALAQVIDEINRAEVVNKESIRIRQLLKQRSQELDKITVLKDGLYMDWKNSDITREDYHRMKQDFEEKSLYLKQVIANLEEENQIMANGVSSEDPYLTSFLKYRNIESLERGIVVELVKQILVHEDGSITIDFKFADQHRRIVEFIENNKRDVPVELAKAV